MSGCTVLAFSNRRASPALSCSGSAGACTERSAATGGAADGTAGAPRAGAARVRDGAIPSAAGDMPSAELRLSGRLALLVDTLGWCLIGFLSGMSPLSESESEPESCRESCARTADSLALGATLKEAMFGCTCVVAAGPSPLESWAPRGPKAFLASTPTHSAAVCTGREKLVRGRERLPLRGNSSSSLPDPAPIKEHSSMRSLKSSIKS